jgi:hypothetical protein
MHVCRADPATLAVLEQEARHAFRSRRLSQVDRLVCERYSEDWLASSRRTAPPPPRTRDLVLIS